jgi:tetratricopeptide (TPR) repeat protein
MDDPNNEEFRRQVAITLSKMATTEYRVGDAGDALSTIAEAVAIRENLLAARPTDEELQKGLLADLIELGTINVALGDRSAALDAFRKSLELSRDLHERAPVDAWRLMKLVIASGSVASLTDGDERAAAVSEASETLSQLTFGRGKTEEEQIWHELLISLQEQ